MANLIKRIAISSSRKQGNRVQVAQEWDSSNLSTSGQKSSATRATHVRRSSIMELNSFGLKSQSERDNTARAVSFMPTGDQIKVTKDIHIQSEPIEGHEGSPSPGVPVKGSNPGEMSVVHSKSLDDLTEGGSVKSDYMHKADSDDEAELVVHQKKGSWHRLG